MCAAELAFLSQYPHEAECLFAPLTGLEALGTRIDGSVLVVEARLSVNLNAQTIEEVVGKRRKLLIGMADSMVVDLSDALLRPPSGSEWANQPAEAAARVALSGPLLQGLALQEPEWFNEDGNFKSVVRDAFEI